MLHKNHLQHLITDVDDIEVDEFASSGEPPQEDDVSLDSASINMPLPPTFPDESIPTTQGCLIVAGGTAQDNDNSGVGDSNVSALLCQSQLPMDGAVMARSSSVVARSSSTSKGAKTKSAIGYEKIHILNTIIFSRYFLPKI